MKGKDGESASPFRNRQTALRPETGAQEIDGAGTHEPDSAYIFGEDAFALRADAARMIPYASVRQIAYHCDDTDPSCVSEDLIVYLRGETDTPLHPGTAFRDMVVRYTDRFPRDMEIDDPALRYMLKLDAARRHAEITFRHDAMTLLFPFESLRPEERRDGACSRTMEPMCIPYASVCAIRENACCVRSLHRALRYYTLTVCGAGSCFVWDAQAFMEGFAQNKSRFRDDLSIEPAHTTRGRYCAWRNPRLL